MRSYRDASGVEWQVWKVTPGPIQFLDRRRSERRASNTAGLEPERRVTADRRRGNIREGWLCFESPEQRLRVHPVPSGWETCSEEELDRLRGSGLRASLRIT
jgi:hypothetical protein